MTNSVNITCEKVLIRVTPKIMHKTTSNSSFSAKLYFKIFIGNPNLVSAYTEKNRKIFLRVCYNKDTFPNLYEVKN